MDKAKNSLPSLAKLVHNRDVSLYQEFLTLGQWLGPDDRRVLYKFLLKKNSKNYILDAKKLMSSNSLVTFIADGQIKYSIDKNILSYSARKNGSLEYHLNVRKMRLWRIHRLNFGKVARFFAQAEVDTIWNFPDRKSVV